MFHVVAIGNRANPLRRSFLRPQSDLDQAADGFRPANFNFLHGYPRIDCCNLLIMPTDHLRLTDFDTSPAAVRIANIGLP